MKIKALTTFKEGYMSEHFVFGGSRKKEKCGEKEYTYVITSYLIDTGKEVILVDTSFPDNITELPAHEGLGIFTGRRIKTFEEALNDSGYKVEDVDKVLLTHNNIDHAGAINLFPEAEVFISNIDRNSELLGENVKGIDFDNGELKNFKDVYEITKNIYMIPAYGHTMGHTIVVAYDENSKLYYMFAGDTTVTNEALIENEVLLVNDDLEMAKSTLNNVREFVKNNSTVYLSTHDPKSVEHLETKKIIYF